MATIDKLPLASMTITDAQREKLKSLFPEVFTEGGKIDWNKLKLTLGDTIDAGKERFGMNWPGKADCFRTIQQPSIATLEPYREESVDFDNTENIFIEGDNLEVLKLLQKSYLGKVKMIYIDPPYNTGHDFIYPDDYGENLNTYLEYTGQVDNRGRRFATNADTDGRFHSKWLNMMYSRLFLAKNLLREDGVIFISIDDGELYNAKKACDELFGESNRIETIIWKNKYGAGAATKGFISTHEYILCYSKSEIENIQGPLSEDEIKKHNKKDEKFEMRGPYRTQPVQTQSLGDRPNLVYPIIYKRKEVWPNKQWVWAKERMNWAMKNNELEFSESNGKVSVRSKQYLKDENGNIRKGKPTSLLNGPFTQEGTAELRELFNKDVFPFPKPSKLVKTLINLQINNVEEKDFIVLDFFAGSATTAHAVLDLNKEDSGNRKFICVQLPEPTDENSEAFKAGYKTIADISKERIRRVIKKIKEEQAGEQKKKAGELSFEEKKEQPQDLGFKVFKLEPSNFKIWNSDMKKEPEVIAQELFEHIRHISPEAKQEAILYELLLKSGFELTTKIDKLSFPFGEGRDGAIFSIAEGELLICLDKQLTPEIIKAMAERKPTRVICLDEGFQDNDQLKTNAVQIMKSKGVLNFRTV